MITAIIIIGIIVIIGAVFGIAFRITGAILMAVLWMLKLPLALILWILGAACCCTIILIPLGLILLRSGTAVLA